MSHIVLTGANGFLGSHLLEALLRAGHKVTVLKRSTSDLWRIHHLMGPVKVVNVDQASIDSAFHHGGIDVVIHTACSYGRHGQSTTAIVEANLVYGLKVLDSAISAGVRTFINTDTLLPRALNPYSLSKHQLTDWLTLKSAQIQVINLKLEHMYGPKDDETKFVPWLIGQLRAGAVRIPLTEGLQQRDFIYIDDVVNAFKTVLGHREALGPFSDFEVGTGTLTSVRAFVEVLYRAYQARHPDTKTDLGFGDIPIREGELMKIDLDNSALRQMGWQAETSIEKGLSILLGENA